MAASLTEVTELATAIGTLGGSLESVLARGLPRRLRFVSDPVWERLQEAWAEGRHHESFLTAHANGRAFAAAEDGLRGRAPRLVEWRGPHRPPGDDVVPADLRIDHVYLVSCKYLSKVLLNPSPSRLFDRVLAGDTRSADNWFVESAPVELQRLYEATVAHTGLAGMPASVTDLDRARQQELRGALASRSWPSALKEPWSDLCRAVAEHSAQRWAAALVNPRDQLRLLWKMLRITSATYFVLGTDRTSHLRIRVESAWDWVQAHELRSFAVAPKPAGQPEVGWVARVRRRDTGEETEVAGHVEVRWSHGRFVGAPEAKVYLDTPFDAVPGYRPLEEGPDQLRLPVGVSGR